MPNEKGRRKKSGETEQASRPALGGTGELTTEKPKPVIVGEAKPEWPPSGAVLFEPQVDDGEEEQEEGEGGEGREGES